MKIKIILLLLISTFFSNFIFSQINEVTIPTHQDGTPIVCEKFEFLEKKIPYLHIPQNNNTTIPLPPQLQANTRTNDDVQVGDSGKSEFEVHAAVNPFDPSNIVVGAMSITGSGAGLILNFSVYYTNDFGSTWARSPFNGEIPNELIGGGGDPMIVFDENGDVYFSWVLVTINQSQVGTWAMYLARSTNGGANWIIDGTPIESNTFTDFVAFSDLASAVDKQWMVTDHSPASDYTGHIYVTYVDINIASGTYNMKVKRRLPGTTSFSNNAVIINTQNYTIAQFASIAVGTDGAVYASFFGVLPNGEFGIYVAKSTDGGATFAAEQKVSNIAFPPLFTGATSINGIDDNRLYPCPHIVTDPSNPDNIYMTWTAYGVNSQASNGLDIYITKSSDAGNSWSTPIVVNNDTDTEAHQFYSSIAVNEMGIVFVSWYDQRDNGGTDSTHYYMGFSLDGGATFEQSNVTSAASDFGQIATSNGAIGPGEYNQIVTTGNWAIPFWGDGRTNNGNISVYAAFLNITQLDVQEIKSLNTQYSFIGPKPNPITDRAVFDLNLKKSSNVEVLLFDMLGRKIKTIVRQNYEVGEYTIEFGTDNLPAGEYIVTLNTDYGSQSEKIIIVK